MIEELEKINKIEEMEKQNAGFCQEKAGIVLLEKEKKEMKVLIIGAGKLGYRLACAIAAADDADVTVVDNNRAVLEHISDHADVMTVKANGIHVAALQEMDASSYDYAVAATGSDETNIICASILKKLGCGKVIARIRNPEYVEHEKFIRSCMGIDIGVNPELATAKVISSYLLKNYSFQHSGYCRQKYARLDRQGAVADRRDQGPSGGAHQPDGRNLCAKWTCSH